MTDEPELSQYAQNVLAYARQADGRPFTRVDLRQDGIVYRDDSAPTSSVRDGVAELRAAGLLQRIDAGTGWPEYRIISSALYVRAETPAQLLMWQHIPCGHAGAFRAEIEPHACPCLVIGPWRALYVKGE